MVLKDRKNMIPAALPEFSDEAEERAFWGSKDSTDYVDWSKAERVQMPNLKPSSVSLDPVENA